MTLGTYPGLRDLQARELNVRWGRRGCGRLGTDTGAGCGLLGAGAGERPRQFDEVRRSRDATATIASATASERVSARPSWKAAAAATPPFCTVWLCSCER